VFERTASKIVRKNPDEVKFTNIQGGEVMNYHWAAKF
jgi:hypothetical protein